MVSILGFTTSSGQLTLDSTTVSDSDSFNFLLDAGTAFNIVPRGYLAPVCEAFGDQNNEEYETCFVRCDSRQYNLGTLDFGFNSGFRIFISVSYNHSVTETNIVDFSTFLGINVSSVAETLDLASLSHRTELSRLSDLDSLNGHDDSSIRTDESIPIICCLNYAEISDNTSHVLGAPFLRDAYAVFDWENQQICHGQAASCGSDVVAFESGSGGVPTTGKCKSAKQTLEDLPASMSAASASDSDDSSGRGSKSTHGDTGTVVFTAGDISSREVVDTGDFASTASALDDSDDNHDDDDDGDKSEHEYESINVWAGAGGAAAGLVLLSGGLFLWRYTVAKRTSRRGLHANV